MVTARRALPSYISLLAGDLKFHSPTQVVKGAFVPLSNLLTCLAPSCKAVVVELLGAGIFPFVQSLSLIRNPAVWG